MCGKPMYLFLSLVVALTSMAQGAAIIWVADNLHYGSVEPNAPADQGFIDLLTAQGYDVIYKDQHDPVNGAQYWRVLDPNKIAELNAADLIIVARDCASGEYDDPNEAQWWNAITTPILLQGPHMARALPKWGLFSSTGTDAGTGVSLMQVVDPNHTIFNGVDLDPNNQADILVPTIKSEFVKGADLLIREAQYTEDEYAPRKGWGHSTFGDAVRCAAKAEVKRLAIFHHDPEHTDDMMDQHIEYCRALAIKMGSAVDCFAAADGLRIDFR